MAALLGVLLVGGLGAPSWNEPKPAFAASYAYSPYFTADGSNLFNQSSSASIRLTDFSLATWFDNSDTLKSYVHSKKSGPGSESVGLNLVADPCFATDIELG